MFEVQDLKYATLATVTRCGMVWFSEDVLSTEMIFDNYLQLLRHVPVEDSEEEFNKPGVKKEEEVLSPDLQVNLFLIVQLEKIFFLKFKYYLKKKTSYF